MKQDFVNTCQNDIFFYFGIDIVIFSIKQRNTTMNYSKFTKHTIVLFITALLASCATLPKATVEMSVLLEKQINVLEDNHKKMTNLYFEEKKQRARTLVDKEWYPNFLESFFNEDIVKETWEDAIKSDTLANRMEVLKDLVQAVQEKYNEVLNLMLVPLEETRIECLTALQEEYQKAKTMSRTISENVSSVHNVQEMRNQLLPANIKDIENTMFQYLQKADNIMNEAQKVINEYDKNQDQIDKYLKLK